MDSTSKPFSGHDTSYDFWRDNAASYGIDEAVIICNRYLDMNLKREHSDDESRFCREIFAAMYEATADKVIPGRLVYPYDFKIASDRWETSYYHKSRNVNHECACAIDKAVSSSCYRTNYYNLELAAMSVIGGYGFERVNALLAHQIQKHESDDRYSGANKKWARAFIITDDTCAFLNSHATLIENLTTHARKLFADLSADRFALLGQEGSYEAVNGYGIIRSVMFNETQGCAIAHNSDACAPFVCWQFTEDNGERHYHWGIYGDKQTAIDGYNARLFKAFN